MRAAFVGLLALAGCEGGAGNPSDAGLACANADASADVTCSSGQFWSDGDRPSTRMRPGLACIECHAAMGGAPVFSIAGTVFPSAHEPDDCFGAAGAIVRIIGADGATLDLATGTTGNFFASAGAVAFPIRAEVRHLGAVRAMCDVRATGDCNACHSQSGANEAPGRVPLP